MNDKSLKIPIIVISCSFIVAIILAQCSNIQLEKLNQQLDQTNKQNVNLAIELIDCKEERK